MDGKHLADAGKRGYLSLDIQIPCACVFESPEKALQPLIHQVFGGFWTRALRGEQGSKVSYKTTIESS